MSKKLVKYNKDTHTYFRRTILEPKDFVTIAIILIVGYFFFYRHNDLMNWLVRLADKPTTTTVEINAKPKTKPKATVEKPTKAKETESQLPSQVQSKTSDKVVPNPKEWEPINQSFKDETKKYKSLVIGGLPKTKSPITLLENIAYYSAYSDSRGNPLWVAYRLDQCREQNQHSRPRHFPTDERTKLKVDYKVYSKSGYDRGHMCPNSAIAARFGREAQLETFLMSNICPQTPELNRKVWERLERLEEGYSNKFKVVWVFAGPIFDDHVQLLKGRVEIPDAFYKILVDEDHGKIRVLPFIIPQKCTGKEILNAHLTTVDEIEKRTGLDFFSTLSLQTQANIESYKPSLLMWR